MRSSIARQQHQGGVIRQQADPFRRIGIVGAQDLLEGLSVQRVEPIGVLLPVPVLSGNRIAMLIHRPLGG